jgi:hypothetical protein
MSDSLKATVIVSELVLTISANGLLELEDPLDALESLDPPRLPAADVPLVALEPDPDPELELDELDDEPPPAEIGSPGDTSATEAMVPAAGAWSLVSSSVSWAFCSVASALSTEAWAWAMLAGEGVLLVDAPPDPEPAEPDSPAPDSPAPV